MNEHPEAEEFDIEEVDNGTFLKCIEKIVPSIESVGFSDPEKPVEKADFSDFAMFLEENMIQSRNGEVFSMVPVYSDFPIDKFALFNDRRIQCQMDWWVSTENFEFEFVKQKRIDGYHNIKKDYMIKLFVSFFKDKRIVTVLRKEEEINK